MEAVATIKFEDLGSGDEAWAFVRVGKRAVGLSVSLREDGDYDVVLNPEDCEKLADALREAVARARRH